MSFKKRKPEPSDVNYGWLVVLSGFCVSFITDGIVYSFGIMLVEIVEQFNQGRASTGVIVSITTGMMHLIGPLAGALSDLYGCRVIVVTGAIISCVGFILSTLATNVYHWWITYGFLGGVGFGLMFIPANVCVLHNFKEQRTLANGIAVCGSGVGMFVFNQLTRFLIDEYGWKGTILLEAGIALHGAIFGLFLVRNTSLNNTESAAPLFDKQNDIVEDDTDIIQEVVVLYSKDVNEYSEKARMNDKDNLENIPASKSKKPVLKNICKSMFDMQLLSDGRCVLFLMSTFIINLGFTIPFNLLPDQGMEIGMTKHEASWLTSSIGITNTVSRIFIGWLGDRPCINRMILAEVLLMLTGIITALSPLLSTFETKMIYTCLFGVFIGGYITLFSVVLADMFGDELIAKSFGLVMFSVGVSGFTSTPLGGLLFDYTGNYNISFIVSGSEFVLGGVFLLLCKYFEPKRITRTITLAVS